MKRFIDRPGPAHYRGSSKQDEGAPSAFRVAIRPMAAQERGR